MRWVLIGLLMGNGIYYFWQTSWSSQAMKSPSSYSHSAEKSKGRGLVLLRELPVNLDGSALDERASVHVPLDIVEAPKNSVSSPSADVSEIESADIDAFCWSIGPFREEISAKQAVNRLAAVGIHLELTTITVPRKPDYWVYIPPLPSRAMSIRLLKELQSKKIDSFLITSGELSRGVSLGFFTQRDRAVSVREARLNQGYSAKIKIVKRYDSEFWGVISASEYAELTDIQWEIIKRGNKGLEKRKNFCDKIASTNYLD